MEVKYNNGLYKFYKEDITNTFCTQQEFMKRQKDYDKIKGDIIHYNELEIADGTYYTKFDSILKNMKTQKGFRQKLINDDKYNDLTYYDNKDELNNKRQQDLYLLEKVDKMVFYANDIVNYQGFFFKISNQDELIHIPLITYQQAKTLPNITYLRRFAFNEYLTVQECFYFNKLQLVSIEDNNFYIKWNLEYIRDQKVVKTVYFQYTYQFNKKFKYGLVLLTKDIIEQQSFSHIVYGSNINQDFRNKVYDSITYTQFIKEITPLIIQANNIYIINLRIAPPDFILIYKFKQYFPDKMFNYYNCVGNIVKVKGGFSEIVNGGLLYPVYFNNNIKIQQLNKDSYFIKINQGSCLVKYKLLETVYFITYKSYAYLADLEERILYGAYSTSERGVNTYYTHTQTLFPWSIKELSDDKFEVTTDLLEVNFWRRSYLYAALAGILSRHFQSYTIIQVPGFITKGFNKLKQYTQDITVNKIQDYVVNVQDLENTPFYYDRDYKEFENERKYRQFRRLNEARYY